MGPNPPSPQHPAAVRLSPQEESDLTNRVMSGNADEAHLVEGTGIARIGTRVLLKRRDRELYCEGYPSERAAMTRYRELDESLGAQRGSNGSTGGDAWDYERFLGPRGRLLIDGVSAVAGVIRRRMRRRM